MGALDVLKRTNIARKGGGSNRGIHPNGVFTSSASRATACSPVSMPPSSPASTPVFTLSSDLPIPRSPQPNHIRLMGDKATARETMRKAGVPTVPGSDGLVDVSAGEGEFEGEGGGGGGGEGNGRCKTVMYWQAGAEPGRRGGERRGEEWGIRPTGSDQLPHLIVFTDGSAGSTVGSTRWSVRCPFETHNDGTGGRRNDVACAQPEMAGSRSRGNRSVFFKIVTTVAGPFEVTAEQFIPVLPDLR